LTPVVKQEPGLIESLKRKSGQILAVNEKRMALHVLYQLLQEEGKEVPTINIYKRASKYTGIGDKTLRSLYHEFNETRDIRIKEIKRGKYERERHWSRYWASSIREVAIRLNQQGIPVTITKIQQELNLAENRLKISNTTMIKILKEIGFRYMNTNKAQNFVETLEMAGKIFRRKNQHSTTCRKARCL